MKAFSTSNYRYGFQGQEQDKEWLGGAVSYKYRISDPRIGKFLSIDPLAPKYPHYSPYAFSGNRVIDAVELEGLEPWEVNSQYQGDENGETTLYGPYRNQEVAQGVVDDYEQGQTDRMTEMFNSINYEIPSYSKNAGGESSFNLDNAVGNFGTAVNVGQEVMFSTTFNTWMGKDFKLRSQSWGGNGKTGGKFKFSQTRAGWKGLGALNYGVGLYNYFSIRSKMKNGEYATNEVNLTRGLGFEFKVNVNEGYFYQGDNLVGTVVPPLISIPKAIGNKLGETYHKEIWDGIEWLMIDNADFWPDVFQGK